MMGDIIQSAGGIVYYIAADGEPRYLLIKRHAVSKKIERVAPKGKLQGNEKMEEAALREISEEAGIPINQMKIQDKLGVTKLRSSETQRGQLDKDTTYFLVEYAGDPTTVHIEPVEGFVGIYKRAKIEDVLGLLYYQDIREIIRKSYHIIMEKQKKNTIKQDFLDKLD